jgi:hypothetical protein
MARPEAGKIKVVTMLDKSIEKILREKAKLSGITIQDIIRMLCAEYKERIS